MRGTVGFPSSLLFLLPLLLIFQDVALAEEEEDRAKRDTLKSVYNADSYPYSYPSTYSTGYPASYGAVPAYSGSYPATAPAYPATYSAAPAYPATYSAAPAYSTSYPGSYGGAPSYAAYPASPPTTYYPTSYPASAPNSYSSPGSTSSSTIAYPYPILYPYPFNNNGNCDCTVTRPADCTQANNEHPKQTPAEGGPACTCTPDSHPQGCQPQACADNTQTSSGYVCTCNTRVNLDRQPSNCVSMGTTGGGSSGGSPSTTNTNTVQGGHTNILGLAGIDGIQNAPYQLGAGALGKSILHDKTNSEMFVDVLNLDKEKQSKSGLGAGALDTGKLDALTGLLGGKKSEVLGLGLLGKRKKREAQGMLSGGLINPIKSKKNKAVKKDE